MQLDKYIIIYLIDVAMVHNPSYHFSFHCQQASSVLDGASKIQNNKIYIKITKHYIVPCDENSQFQKPD